MAEDGSDSMSENSANNDQGQGSADSGGTDGAAEKTFSQAEVDRIVQDRIARVKKEPPADYDDLKKKAKRFDEIEEANKSELEKATTRAEKAEADSAAAIKRANDRLIEAAVLTEATSQNAIKPEHLHRLIKIDEVTVGDDGQVTGAAEAVKAFLESNPEYVGTRANGSADQGARGGGANQLTRDALKNMTPDQIVQARKDGRLAKVLGGG